MIYFFYMLLTAFFCFVDHITKSAAIRHLMNGKSLPLLKDVFHLTYCENTGAAFSMFSGNPKALAIISGGIILAFFVYIYIKKPKDHIFLLSCSLILSGGLGNMTDRITKGYVVDFLDFTLIDFPVFNVADIFVCCGVFLLACYILFQKEPGEKEKK